MEIELQYSVEGLLELLVHQSVDERVDNAVRVAEKVAKIEEMVVRTSGWISTKALDQSTDMVGRPAENECTSGRNEIVSKLDQKVYHQS